MGEIEIVVRCQTEFSSWRLSNWGVRAGVPSGKLRYSGNRLPHRISSFHICGLHHWIESINLLILSFDLLPFSLIKVVDCPSNFMFQFHKEWPLHLQGLLQKKCYFIYLFVLKNSSCIYCFYVFFFFPYFLHPFVYYRFYFLVYGRIILIIYCMN